MKKKIDDEQHLHFGLAALVLAIVLFVLCQLQFKDGEKRVVALENHPAAPHWHRYHDGKAVYNVE